MSQTADRHRALGLHRGSGDSLFIAEEAVGKEATERARAEGFAMNLDQILELVAAHDR